MWFAGKKANSAFTPQIQGFADSSASFTAIPAPDAYTTYDTRIYKLAVPLQLQH